MTEKQLNTSLDTRRLICRVLKATHVSLCLCLKSLIPKYHNSEVSREHPELLHRRRRAFSPFINFFPNAITRIWPGRQQGLRLG